VPQPRNITPFGPSKLEPSRAQISSCSRGVPHTVTSPDDREHPRPPSHPSTGVPIPSPTREHLPQRKVLVPRCLPPCTHSIERSPRPLQREDKNCSHRRGRDNPGNKDNHLHSKEATDERTGRATLVTLVATFQAIVCRTVAKTSQERV